MSAYRDRFSCVINFGDSLIHNRSVQDVAIFRIYFIFLKKKRVYVQKCLIMLRLFSKFALRVVGGVIFYFFFFVGGVTKTT